jgi:serine/threonine protein kinase
MSSGQEAVMDLFETITCRGILSEKEISQILHLTLLKIQKYHQEGVIIGNLSPEAIFLLRKEGKVLVKINSMSQITMSPVFAAPEVLDFEQFDKGSDLWSIGAIAYLGICGYPPFYADTMKELYQTIRTAAYEFDESYWRGNSNESKDFIRRCLRVHAKDRMTAKEALEDPFITKYNTKPSRLIKSHF